MVRDTLDPFVVGILAATDSRQQSGRGKGMVDAIRLPVAAPCIFVAGSVNVPPRVGESRVLERGKAIDIAEVIQDSVGWPGACVEISHEEERMAGS